MPQPYLLTGEREKKVTWSVLSDQLWSPCLKRKLQHSFNYIISCQKVQKWRAGSADQHLGLLCTLYCYLIAKNTLWDLLPCFNLLTVDTRKHFVWWHDAWGYPCLCIYCTSPDNVVYQICEQVVQTRHALWSNCGQTGTSKRFCSITHQVLYLQQVVPQWHMKSFWRGDIMSQIPKQLKIRLETFLTVVT